METLDSIIIKNIRRFGNDVTIDIGQGATIFYAPNGTGKTSIFESIELALTGSTKRLDKNFKPLMRDKCTDSLVRLNFSSGNFCQANLANGGTLSLTGNHDRLFGDTPRENIPFLLRLTHLLNQRADGWFVQSQTSSDAGTQLGYLSIGREAIQAKNVITSTKRAATALKEENKVALDSAKAELENWFELLTKRDSSINLEPARPLISYEELFSSLNQIARSFDYNKLIYQGDIKPIRNQHSEILSILAQKEEEVSNRLIKLDALKPLVTDYFRIIEQSIEYRRSNVLLAEERSTIELKISKLRIELSDKEKQLSIHTTTYKNSLDRLEKLLHAVELKSTIFDLAAQIDSYELQLEEYKETYDFAKKAHEANLDIVNKHQLLFNRSVALSEKKSILTSQSNAIIQWRQYNKNIAELINDLQPNFELEYNKDSKTLNSLTEQRNEQLSLLSEAKRLLDIINTANDAVTSAVSIIISTLPTQTGTCPVCTQQYEPDELRRRMNAALGAISPELHDASSRVDEARTKLAAIDKKLFTATNKFTKSSNLLTGLKSNVIELQKELSTLINNTFPNTNSVDIAEEQCRLLITENEAAFQDLEYQKSLLSTPPSEEDIADVQSNLENLGSAIAIVAEKIRFLERARDKALNNSYDGIAEPSMQELDELIELVDDELLSIRSNELSTEILRKEITQQLRLLEDTASKSSFLNKQLVDINANINQYTTQWSLLKLPQEPSETLLLTEINLAKEALKQIELGNKRLEQLEIEIGRRLSIAEHSATEKRISEIKGALSEIEYTSLLGDKVQNIVKEQKHIQSKITTLNSFSTNLGHQIDGIHEIITSINPLWKSLLKRIVIDPRFSETVLRSYGSYNKQHANVAVPLHGENSLAHHVASEAQITDLQLTFLLALAQNYEWTPWRALLLDDPTQHHDLVHASAVFDLLRDYIAEKNFQVLLATHDQVQAKFFMRKLQNDGIPARICTLQATSTGVVPVYKD
jgi:exonuclease SbcC